MKLRSVSIIAVFLFIGVSEIFAQNTIGVRKCTLEPAKIDKKQPELESYVLRLSLRYTLASEETALLKVAVDPKEEQNFQTVAEKRLRKGRGVPLELEIPINDWKTEKLNVFLLVQGKDPTPDGAPLANVTKIIEKTTVSRE